MDLHLLPHLWKLWSGVEKRTFFIESGCVSVNTTLDTYTLTPLMTSGGDGETDQLRRKRVFDLSGARGAMVSVSTLRGTQGQACWSSGPAEPTEEFRGSPPAPPGTGLQTPGVWAAIPSPIVPGNPLSFMKTEGVSSDHSYPYILLLSEHRLHFPWAQLVYSRGQRFRGLKWKMPSVDLEQRKHSTPSVLLPHTLKAWNEPNAKW